MPAAALPVNAKWNDGRSGMKTAVSIPDEVCTARYEPLSVISAACYEAHQPAAMQGTCVIGTLCLLVISSLFAPTQSGVSASSSQGKVLIIDGAKNPEEFPEWYVWEFTFRTMSTTSDSAGR